MTLGPNDLVLCAATAAHVPLLERIELAASAGFRGVSLFLDDLDALNVSDAVLNDRLHTLGLQVTDLDPMLTWFPGASAGGSGFMRWGVDDFLHAAGRVGASALNAACFVPNVSLDDLLEPFGKLCDRAGEAGLGVHLEFMPFSVVNDFEAALHIIESVGRPNAGIMLDVWHFHRSGSDPNMLERHASRVTSIQLNDCPAEPESNLIEETMKRRLLPGDGAADVAGLIRLLDSGGCTAPLGVEVFSEDLAALAASDAIGRAADATRKVVAEARSAGS